MSENEITLKLPLEDVINIMVTMETALWLLKEHLEMFESHIVEINEMKDIVGSNELEINRKITKLENKTKLLRLLYLSREEFIDSLTAKINESGIDIEKEVLNHLKENGSQWRTE